MKLLIAEDEPLCLSSLKEIDWGAQGISTVLTAENGEQAYRLALSEKPDIILSDIQMPKMNGYDATRAIRAMNRRYCKQIPIVAMTANAFAEDVQAAKTVGMNEHIAKPLDLKMLAKTLNKWLR